jgi:hypothetical protein
VRADVQAGQLQKVDWFSPESCYRLCGDSGPLVVGKVVDRTMDELTPAERHRLMQRLESRQ